MLDYFIGMRCPDCSKRIRESDNICPHCGVNLDAPLDKTDAEALAQQYLDKAERLFMNRRNSEALIECNKALEYAPDFPEAHILRRVIQDEMGEHLGEYSTYQEAIRLHPGFLDAKLNLQESEAEIDSITQYYLKKAEQTFVSAGNIDEALKYCEKALKYKPDSAEAHNMRGMILDYMDETEEAILAYKDALRIDPYYQDAQTNLEEAVSEYNKSHQRIKDLPTEQSNSSWGYIIIVVLIIGIMILIFTGLVFLFING